MKEKTKWEAPKLILLGRGNPEEHVLGKCIEVEGPYGKFYDGSVDQYDS